MAVSSAMVIAVALGYWLRDVRRNQDTDGVEPSPVSERAALYMLLAGVVFIGTRLARGQSLPFGFIAFAAVFIGFGLSACWYLLARRATDGPSASRVAMFSGGVAASFGALSALATN
jgi:hypothetical protein